MIVCHDCQYQNPDDMRFCLNCGADLAPIAGSAPGASTVHAAQPAAGGFTPPGVYPQPALSGTPVAALDWNTLAADLQSALRRSLGTQPAIVIGLGVAGAVLAVVLGQVRLRGNTAIVWSMLVYGVCVWGAILLAYVQVRVPETVTTTALTARAVMWLISAARGFGLGTIAGFVPWDALAATWWLLRVRRCDRRSLVQASAVAWVGSLTPQILYALLGRFLFDWWDLAWLAVFVGVGYAVYLVSVSARWLPAEPGVW
jgi:hypothetical protein